MSAIINPDQNDINNVAANQPVVPVKLTAEELGAKARDKVEVYHLCAYVFGAYVPDIDQVSTWHLRDLITNVKTRINSHTVKYLHVPNYEHLAVEDFLDIIEQYPFVQMCLPDRKKEKARLGRQYLINVLYTRLGQKFKEWVNERVNARHAKVKEEGDKYINLDP